MQKSIIGKALFLVVVRTASAGTLAPLRRSGNTIGSIDKAKSRITSTYPVFCTG
ncbi:hypothetical protein CSB93_0460 [Pseudomonas paraeruginosa]|uniref:Uncharacterized protein n=1 Tax=Pseudomonas paraeruginosa TaxID=2994495 RepID=A0A2R3IYB3_9PSED|nr:hypothetical protein CSB93_0460 [Pseudomonas paraeruginosa]AWE89397.1 hypothetical protein CSC28_5773 [Pseudomonas paraeruginosa]PTC34099.1 hypothetical protein CLJ1_5307 [Pseudomonas aeruginosa]